MCPCNEQTNKKSSITASSTKWDIKKALLELVATIHTIVHDMGKSPSKYDTIDQFEKREREKHGTKSKIVQLKQQHKFVQYDFI